MSLPPLLADLILSNRQQALPAVGLLIISLLLLWLSYRHSPLKPTPRRIAFALKAFGFALLGFCFLEPMWTDKSIKPGSNIIVQLADNSQGLDLFDAGDTLTRAEALYQFLQPAAPRNWQATIEKDFNVRRYQFDSRLNRVESFADLDFTGETSDLASALQLLRERFAQKPLAGVLLFTDGNLTDLPDDPNWMAGLPPIFPVTLGKETLLPDARIQQVTVSETLFEDAPVTIQVELGLHELAGHSVTARLTHATGDILDRQVVTASTNTERASIRFRFRPPQSGVSHYAIDLLPPVGIKEATLRNNHHALTLDRGAGPYRILYIAGRPNWEYKFLRRAISDDHELDLVGLLRMAKREPKFDFRGRSGETSNPLFRGFKEGSEEDDEQYDQSVIIRMNTRDETELIGGFPKEAESLFGFQGLIIDDLEAEFFSPDQMTLIEQFVAQRGGGLLMLGGQESYHEGGYDKTPIGKLLPVYLDRETQAPDYQPIRLALTREGLLQPWVRLRETEDAESKRLDEVPAFSVLNRLPAIKPGASVLAEAQDAAGNTFPAIAVQRFGAGQTAAITIGDLWRWGFESEEQQADLARGWRQILRWLIKDVPPQVDVHVQSQGTATRLEIQVNDTSFKPLDNATVTCIIQPPDGEEPIELTALPSEDTRGAYTCELLTLHSGSYAVTVRASDPEKNEIGTATTGWSINRNQQEFASLTPNRPLLEQLATATGGEMVELDQLDSFADTLSQREMPVMESWSRPAWHTPIFFLLALGCFVGEWGIRRKGGAR